jgi:flagellar hook-length control protein FliK
VPSIASEVSATLSLGSPQWLQGRTVAPDTDTQPFAALLDANSSAPDATSIPANSPPAPAAANDTTPSTNGANPVPPSTDAASARGGNAVPPAKNVDKFSANAAGSPPGTNAANLVASATNGGKATTDATGNTNPILAAAANPKVRNKPTLEETKGSDAPPSPTNAGAALLSATGANNARPSETKDNTSTASTPSGTNTTSGNSSKQRTPVPDTATMNSADLATATNGPYPPVEQPAAPLSSIKTPSAEGKADADNNGSETNLSAIAATASETQAAANPAQPVAAAVVVNSPVSTVPASGNGPAASTVIGAPNRARATLIWPVDADQNVASAQEANNAAPAKQAPSTSKSDDTSNAATGSSDAAARAQGSNDRSSQQAATEAPDNAVSPGQPPAPLPADSGRGAVPSAEPSAASSSNTAASLSGGQGAGATKADVAGLPNFGFIASPATTAATQTAAASGATLATAVPIAGLAVAISARALAGFNQFEIKLAPPELGRIVAQLGIDGNGQVSLHMTVQHSDTLQLLQSQQPQLQSALEQAGLKPAANGLQFTLGDQSFAGQNNGSGSQPTPAQLVIPEPDLAPLAATQIYTRTGVGSGIDIRV